MSAARQKFGAMADEFLALYPASTDGEAALASNDAMCAPGPLCATLGLGRMLASPTYPHARARGAARDEVDLLVSRGNDLDRLYAAVVRADDGKVLAKATRRGAEQYRRSRLRPVRPHRRADLRRGRRPGDRRLGPHQRRRRQRSRP